MLVDKIPEICHIISVHILICLYRCFGNGIDHGRPKKLRSNLCELEQ